MDLEHLNRTQTILLTLLVSFVTSIATGIVTVSLMNQAPPELAATVDHVIEHTVQQVSSPAQSAAATTVRTVVVSNDGLAAQSIATVQKSIIRIVDASAPDLLVSRGILIDSKGTALTDRDALSASSTYTAILFDGSRVPLIVRPAATTSAVAVVDLTIGTSTPGLTAATFVDPSALQLGQTVIRIGGTGNDTVAEGVIASIPQKARGALVEASIGSQTPGSVLVSLSGGVIGMTTTSSSVEGADFYSMPDIFKAAAASATAATAAQAATGK